MHAALIEILGGVERLKGRMSKPVPLPHHQAITILQAPQQGGIERPIASGLPLAFSCTMLASGTPAVRSAVIWRPSS
jgi:hypothetical protein